MFAALNVHSHYSLGWGIASPDALCSKAVKSGYSALALTDTNGLYGLGFFIESARAHGIQPIVGAELSAGGQIAVGLVRSREGYANLCQLITACLDEPNASMEKLLTKSSEGLVILTGHEELIRGLNGRVECLYALLSFGALSWRALQRARRLMVPIVASSRTFFLNREDYKLHRLHRAITLNTTLERLSQADAAAASGYLVSAEEMKAAFSLCPEALDNSHCIAEMCRWTPDFGVVYPPVDLEFNGEAMSVLRRKCYQGARRRYGEVSSEVKERIERELNMIAERGFAPVFLVVEDIVKRFPRTCGRGSAAASIVSYCLGITHVEPLRNRLFFERFINPARVEPPDIDIDFAWDERDFVLEYVFNRYGDERTAMVSNHVTYQPRSSVREVAKVFGLTDAEIGMVTKRISYSYSHSSSPITDHPALRDFGFPPPWPEIFTYARRLEDVPRHLSVHCGGVVITPEVLTRWVPTEIAPKGVRIVQWEKDQVEDFGLVKIDLLGNRSLAVIRDALSDIREHSGLKLDYNSLNPIDDPETQALIARGDTMGVFYVESPATRLLQRKAGVGDYDHLVLHSSIIRPAANKFINMYLRRLKGEPWEPLHPLIGELLDENYGIMVYQEDVTQVAMKLASFPLAEADELRKILSKKHKQRRLLDLKRKFYEGAAANGVEEAAIDRIWEMIMSFAGYSFCKPHSASYALVSFKSAYLRAHFPAEFMAAVISNQGGYYTTFAYVSEARRMGLRILPPDINASVKKHTGRRDWLRIGFMQIKGLSENSMDAIVASREKDGPFLNFAEFVERLQLAPSETALLVKAGCFDELEPSRTRPELLWQLALTRREMVTASQGALFNPAPIPPPKVPQFDDRRLLEHEIETLGFLLSRHPMELYREKLNRRPVVRGCDLGRHVGQRVEAAGWFVTSKAVFTREDEPMEFITFEDTTALIETVLFPDAFRKFSHIVSRVRPYRLFGKVEEDFGAVTLTVDRLEYL